MNKTKEALKELMSNNNCSIYDLTYTMDFDIEEYKEYLISKMRDRAEEVFKAIEAEIGKHPHFSESIKRIKIADINGYKNGSGMTIVFSLIGKDHILIYNLWDMVNYPKEHTDSITLMLNFNETSKDLDDTVANAVGPYLNVTTTDVNTKIATNDVATDDSLATIKNIITALEILFV